MKKIIICLLISIMLLSFVAAEQSLGTFKQNSCISLKQTCANCTFVNITSVLGPNGQQIWGQKAMTQTGSEYNYTFCSTNQIGQYTYNTYGDPDGTKTVQPVNFEVTPSGFADTLGFYILLVVVICLVIALGFSIKDGWFVVIGGMSLIILGLYSLNSGIAGFRDMFLTWGIALFEMGTGTYLSVNSAIELIGDTAVS